MSGTEPTRAQQAIGLHALDEATCWERLREADIARVAVVHRGRPHLVPVGHRVDGESVAFVSLPGTKLDDVCNRPGTPIVLEVDGSGPDGVGGWSVVVTGTAHFVANQVDKAHLDRLGRPAWLRDHQQSNWIRITDATVTGRHT